MRKPGAKRRVLPVVIAIAAVVAAGWWWTHRGHEPVTSTLTQPQHGTPTATVAHAAQAAAPARLTITVTDEHGPLTGALVRLAPADGDVLVVHTGTDGIAHADQLAPGTWRISASADGHAPAALPTQQLTAGADVSLAVRLSAGGRILSGVVADATGGVIAGARIDAAKLTQQASPGEAVSTAITGADGKYRLTVAEGTLLVAASNPDYAPQSRYVEVGPTGATADFALVPGGVIEGIVRDQRSHEPVAGAAVIARHDSAAMVFAEAATHRATAGSDGRFRLAGLRPGAWELAATAEARHTKAQTVVGVGVAEQVTNIELLVGDGPVIRGRVIDDAGAPAPSVSVRARTRGNATEVTADAAGAFVVEGLAPGNYALDASGASYLSATAAPVELTDHDVDNVIVKVSRGLTLRGHVEPRQPCEIRVDNDDSRASVVIPALGPSGASDPDGNFALGPVVDGPIRLAARCTSGDQGSAAFDHPGNGDLVVTVAPGASIAGRVVDADGKPLTATGVMASEVSTSDRTTIVNGMITSGVHALTDASGAYQIDGLAAGTYRVTALDRGKPLHMHAPAPTVALAANEHKTGVDLTVDRANGTIAGTITGPDGKPVADAWVSAQPDPLAMMLGPRGGAPGPSGSTQTMIMQNDDSGVDSAVPPALTDAQGHYELHGLVRTPYNVVAEAQHGQLRARADNITPDATVDLHVVGVTSLSGTVTGPAGPAALFTVELIGPTRTQRSFTAGSYSFDRVDPGSYTVRVEAADGNAQGSVTVSPDQPATLDLVLAANATVIGKLVDPNGAPLADQPIVLTPDTGDGRVSIRLEGPPVTSTADGSFRLSHSAEPVIFLVMGQPRPFMKRLTLQAGATIDLGTIKLSAPGGGSAAPPGPGAPAQPNTTPRVQRRPPVHLTTPAAPVATL